MATVESMPSIDIRRWMRTGCLTPGCILPGGLCRGYVEGQGGQADAIVLHYRLVQGGRQIALRVSLAWAPCHYGGERVWYVCPVQRCSRRCAMLYPAGRIWACRRCCRLRYKAEMEPKHYRGMETAQKIVDRLGGGLYHTLPDKPPRMHWRTYERLQAAHDAAMDRSMRGFGQLANSLSRRVGIEPPGQALTPMPLFGL